MTTAFVDFNGVVPEKFDAVKLSHLVDAEYGNQGIDFKMIPREGFGWMNGACSVYQRYMIDLALLTFPRCLLQPPTKSACRTSPLECVVLSQRVRVPKSSLVARLFLSLSPTRCTELPTPTLSALLWKVWTWSILLWLHPYHLRIKWRVYRASHIISIFLHSLSPSQLVLHS